MYDQWLPFQIPSNSFSKISEICKGTHLIVQKHFENIQGIKPSGKYIPRPIHYNERIPFYDKAVEVGGIAKLPTFHEIL